MAAGDATSEGAFKRAPKGPPKELEATEQALGRVSFYTRAIFTFGVAMIGLIAVARWVKGEPVDFVLSMLLFQSLSTLGLWLTRPHRRVGAGIALFALLVVECMTLAHFGPFAGVGMLVALAVVVAVAHFGPRFGAVILLVATLFIVLVGGALTRGPTTHVINADLGQITTWIRTAMVTICLGAFVLFTLNLVLGALRRAAEEARAAQRFEAEARRDQETTALALGRARELETVGRLAGGGAHDFNNALTVILACASELHRQMLSADGTALAKDIETAARGAATTTAQLMAFARRQIVHESQCDPGRSLEQSLKNLNRLLPEDVRLTTSFEGGMEVSLGSGELLQVVINLVLNAHDACSAGGEIRLSVRRDGTDVAIEVEDTGSGMDEATRARLFEPFFTTKGGRGSGLGLAMVRGAVTRVGGRVDVTSTLGKGTNILVHLPGVAKQPAAAPAKPPGRLELAGLSVLVVEDEKAIRMAMRRCLEQAGARVHEAWSSQQALLLLQEGHLLDVLCTDGILADGNALPVIAEFCKQYPQAPVLLCSGHVPDELESRGLLPGAKHQRLPKPFTGPELIEAIGRLGRS